MVFSRSYSPPPHGFQPTELLQLKAPRLTNLRHHQKTSHVLQPVSFSQSLLLSYRLTTPPMQPYDLCQERLLILQSSHRTLYPNRRSTQTTTNRWARVPIWTHLPRSMVCFC